MEEQRWEEISKYFWSFGRERDSSSESESESESELTERLLEVAVVFTMFSGRKRQSRIKLRRLSLT